MYIHIYIIQMNKNKLRSLYDNKYIQTPFWEDWLEDK